MNSRRMGFALVLCLAVARVSTAAPVAEIPFHAAGSQILLPVRIASSDTLWFILDTGAEGGVVNQARAEQLGLKVTGENQSRGAGGTVTARQLGPLDLEVGPVRMHVDHYGSIPLTGLPQRMGHVIDGIVGSELFRRYVVEIDYAAQIVRLHEPKTFDYRGHGQELPLTYTNNHPYTKARIVLSDGRKLEGRFVIDSGSSQGIILLTEFATRNHVSETVTKTVPVAGLGVGGEVSSKLGRLPAVELGSLRLGSPLVSLPPPVKGGQFAASGNAGNLGGAILKKFHCYFDYSRDRLILEPVADLDDPMPFDASGMSLVSAGAAFDTIKVTRVIPGSPAAEAGIEPGDAIRSLDAVPAGQIGVVPLRERLRRKGETVKLEVARGGRHWTVPLQLRDLL